VIVRDWGIRPAGVGGGGQFCLAGLVLRSPERPLPLRGAGIIKAAAVEGCGGKAARHAPVLPPVTVLYVAAGLFGNNCEAGKAKVSPVHVVCMFGDFMLLNFPCRDGCML
jgi:hypothetical protein